MNIRMTIDHLHDNPFNWYRPSGTTLYHAHPSSGHHGENNRTLCGQNQRSNGWDDAYLGESSFNLPHCDACELLGIMLKLSE